MSLHDICFITVGSPIHEFKQIFALIGSSAIFDVLSPSNILAFEISSPGAAEESDIKGMDA